MQKLSVKAFALAWGLSCGVWFMILGWIASTGWAVKVVEVFSSAYIGYAPGFWGGVIGGVWAFFDWAIGAAIVAWLYNIFIRKK